ncbi:MAG: 3-phosphoshikimate 1-carboxyvinyltransferase [Clostridiales bacterium]|nr:3-phosphoshikimate 1-carboxyvinyltransferase [Clostridiales bacterium]
MQEERIQEKLPEIYASGKLGIAPGKLKGDVLVPQSKSAAHRALIMAFLSGNIDLAKIDVTHVSDDIKATKRALIKMGEALAAEGKGLSASHVASADDQEERELHREGSHPYREGPHPSEPIEIDCKESGSTLRFLIPLAAVLGIPTKFIGSGRLPQRPIKEYEGVFAGSGAKMQYLDQTGLSLPLLITGKMRSGEYSLPGNVSSQYISGLLMALSAADGASRLTLTTDLESRPYVDMTCEVMRAFGVEVKEQKNDREGEEAISGYSLSGENRPDREEAYEVEADYSQAAFWLVADYIGSEVNLKNLPKSTAQGDCAIVDLLSGLRETGKKNDEAGKTAASPDREIFEMDARDVPDLVPVFAIAAAATNCITKIVHAERLRIKESDRIASTSAMLTVLGIENTITEDGIEIVGRSYIGAAQEKETDITTEAGDKCFAGGTVDSCKDHRLVMAAAIAATRAEDTVWIKDPVAVEKSYPAFFEDYINLGGKIDGINVG